jgi:hypothetical protein
MRKVRRIRRTGQGTEVIAEQLAAVPAAAATGTAAPFHAGGDQCFPGAIAVQPDPMTPADGEDFAGLVFGDVTGNWQPTSMTQVLP